MEKTKEILNFLISQKNLISVVILIVTFVAAGIAFMQIIKPKIDEAFQLKSDIETNQTRYDGLKQQKKAKELEEKKNLVKFDKVPVVIYKSSNPGLPVESSSIDFVSKVVQMMEQTNNTILDISYKIDPLSENDKISIPSTISVVQLSMTLNGTYLSLQDFIHTLYDYDYLATIKTIKVVPLKENKNILEINMVLWLYVTR